MESDKQEPSVGISSDTPQVDPVFDCYGYAPFAQLIADAVVKTPNPQGLVMAIHGPWGSGKSSLLNFIKHYLTEQGQNDKAIVVDFNPWWFDDRSHLAAQFLAQLKTKLKLETGVLLKAGDLMATYSGALGKAVAWGTGHPWVDVPVGALLKFFKRKPKDVPALKKQLADTLKESKKRILVVIDDIDRLTPIEIREVFKVVKALADFPNVVYLLSFDREVVAEALRQALGVDGEAYLEKIVQVPFSLPAVDSLRLQDKLSTDLDQILAGADSALIDTTYWGNLFMDGLAPSITKPRDIVRYVNALAVTYPPMRNEVNIADFFALEFLRVNQPRLYETIKGNQQFFAGYARTGLNAREREDERKFHQAWIADLDENIRDGVQSMMERIFPRLDDMGRGGEFLHEWRKFRRAASPDVFPCYFKFSIDTDRLTRSAMASFIEEMTDQGKTETTLIEALKTSRIDGKTVAREYIEYLIDYEDEIDPSRALVLLKTLGNVGDRLIAGAKGGSGGLAIPGSLRLTWLLQHVLARIQKEQRDDQLILSFKKGKSLTYLCETIQAIESCHQKPVNHGPAQVLTDIKPSTIPELKQLAITRIIEAADQDQLLNTPELPAIMIRWRDWVSPDAPRKWCADNLMADPVMLLRFLSVFMGQSRTTTFGDSVGRIHHSLGLKLLSDFLDLDCVADVLKKVEATIQLGNEQRLVVTTFNSQYPIFKQGKDPDSPFVMMGLS